MAKLKTRPNELSALSFLNELENEAKKVDCLRIYEMMQEITETEASMWGGSIVGFGSYHYIYESGREGDWFLAGFSPRKQNISIYIMAGLAKFPDLLEKLGKYKMGKGCLYIKKLADVDENVLKELIRASVKILSEKYPSK